MPKKYLDNVGLSHFWDKIKQFVLDLVATKQDTLTAGDNVDISNNVISVNNNITNLTGSIAYVESVPNYFFRSNDEFDDGGQMAISFDDGFLDVSDLVSGEGFQLRETHVIETSDWSALWQ